VKPRRATSAVELLRIGAVRGTITGVILGLGVVASFVVVGTVHAIVKDELGDLSDGWEILEVMIMVALPTGLILGLGVGLVCGIAMIPFRRHVDRLWPVATITAFVVSIALCWWWLALYPTGDQSSSLSSKVIAWVVGISLVVATAAAVAAWNLRGATASPADGEPTLVASADLP
jgi:hypothetical protein